MENELEYYLEVWSFFKKAKSKEEVESGKKQLEAKVNNDNIKIQIDSVPEYESDGRIHFVMIKLRKEFKSEVAKLKQIAGNFDIPIFWEFVGSHDFTTPMNKAAKIDTTKI